MIEAARSSAEREASAVRLVEGRFEDLAGSLGTFGAVTIGRAIHWLDPEPARNALDSLVAPQELILVCNAASVTDGRNRWLETFNAVRNRWRGEHPNRDQDAFFAGGPFVRRKSTSVETVYRAPIEKLADRVLSMSTSSPNGSAARFPRCGAPSERRSRLSPLTARWRRSSRRGQRCICAAAEADRAPTGAFGGRNVGPALSICTHPSRLLRRWTTV